MKPLTVAAIQTDPVFGKIEDNLERALGDIPSDCDLAVLPELFATGYQFTSRTEAMGMAEDLAKSLPTGPITSRLTRYAADTGTTLIAGLAERSGDAVFNAAVLVRPDGSRGVYRKVHLFLEEKSIFTPGDLGFPVFPACGTTVGIMICFDWIFPEAARSLALAGAEIIAHPANLLLPWCQAAMITRCQENMVYAATANRIGTENRTGQELVFSGRSQVVSPRGERLVGLGPEDTGPAVAAITPTGGDKQFTRRNHLWDDRRPDAYRT